ncbi:MAG TPA: hypothetical protein PK308_00830 [Phycisphaerales bacterium]|nr:hypothetical protein [Phycisphaerales bacterium]
MLLEFARLWLLPMLIAAPVCIAASEVRAQPRANGAIFALQGDRVERCIVTWPGGEPEPSSDTDASPMLAALGGRLAVLPIKGYTALSQCQSNRGFPPERVPNPVAVADVIIEGQHSSKRVRLFEGEDGSLFGAEVAAASPADTQPSSGAPQADEIPAYDPEVYPSTCRLDRGKLIAVAEQQGWRWPTDFWKLLRKQVVDGEEPGVLNMGATVALTPPFSPGRLWLDKRTVSERLLGKTVRSSSRTERILSSEQFFARLPKSYDPRQPSGLLVWIDAGPVGEVPRALDSALDDSGLVCVAPANIGNDRPTVDRLQLALDAVATASARFHIDPARVYVGGVSGGGRIASMAVAGFPDVFTGALCIVGLNSYRNTPSPFGGQWTATYVKPQARLWDLYRTRPIGVMTGQRDFNYLEITTSVQLLSGDGLTIKLFDNATMGHQMPEPEWARDCLRWIDGAARTRSDENSRSAAEAIKRVTDRLRDRPGLTGTQRRDLIDITSNWPWTPAAWDAAAILGATPGLKHDEPAPAVKPAAGKP